MKKASLFLTLMAISVISFAQTIEHTYHFNQPIITRTTGNYQQINFEGCIPSSKVGEPMLPWQNVSLMLPQGYEATDISIDFSDFIEMEGSYNLMPAQLPRPISETRSIPFSKNEDLYHSFETYPADFDKHFSNQQLNGVRFAFSGFSPLQYIPATGAVRYAQTVKVTIALQASRSDDSQKLWLRPENQDAIQRLAQNDALHTYINIRGRELSGYDMLVITTNDWAEPLTSYIDFYNDRGIRTHIATLEDIYEKTEGRDNQEKIRNFIIQEYENNGIMMVSLGGDVSIVPYRSLWCFAQEGYEDYLPSDMYYAALDGTLNDDDDDRWGEVGEDDLLPELGIGRLPFNSQEQLDIILNKTFNYLENPVLGEFTSPILGAEHLGDGYYGSDDMERLVGECNDYEYRTIGYPTHYDFKKYYATPSLNWSGTDFKRLIGTGGQYVHHVGHANADFVAGWTGSMMSNNFFAGNDGINHNFMLFHSHGCICGDFPGNCVLEKMVTIPTGFVVTAGNSRYGWYQPWGDGMAAHIHRELVDAYWNDHIPFISMALREAKIATAPWVTMWGEEGCMRWNLYCLNILGDAALMPWFEEPFIPDVLYPQALQQGTANTTVVVKHNGQALENFRVSFFKGDELIGYGLSDSNGEAFIEFPNPDELVGDIVLVVTGMSAWPQHLPVNGLTNQPFLYVSDYQFLNTSLNTGITDYSLQSTIFNPSNQNLSDISVSISCDSQYINITAGQANIDNLDGEALVTLADEFRFQVADNAPDQVRTEFVITCIADGQEWVSTLPFYFQSPKLEITNIAIDDSQGNSNGLIEEGETIIIHVSGINAGHQLAESTILTATCSDPQIHIDGGSFDLGSLGIGDTFSAEVVFTSDEDVLGGSIFHMLFHLQSFGQIAEQDFAFGVGYATETFESGDFSFMQWDHSGDLPWIIDNESHSGDYSARSGQIDDDEISSLLIYMDTHVDGNISFYYKTSTDKRDYLVFFVDGNVIDLWDQETDWTFFSHPLSAGSHVVEFRYDKSPKDTSGQDCVWIDDISFPPTCIVTHTEENSGEKHNAIYPNPSQGAFTIALATDDSDISIFNALGQTIMQRNAASGYQQINLQAKGMYFIQIKSEDGVEVLKMIVE